MSIEFKLPSIGEGVTSADVAQIMVQPGDSISAGQVVMELETEKAVVELPCPHAGKLEKLLVKAGDSIKVGQAIMTIEANGAPAAKPAAAPAKPTAAKSETPAKAESAKPAPKPAAAEKPAGAIGAIEFTVPSLGEGVNQADVAELLVKVGDTITTGQMVAELETEKAVVELPCPHAGKVTAVHVKAGDTIKVGAKFLTVEGSTAAAPSRPAASPSPAAAEPAKQPAAAKQPPSRRRPRSPSPRRTARIPIALRPRRPRRLAVSPANWASTFTTSPALVLAVASRRKTFRVTFAIDCRD